eukprot:1389715-Amphidinium_carterae.1
MAPSWFNLIKRHACVHYLTVQPSDGATDNRLTLWIHSSLETLDRLVTQKADLGQRFAFFSPAQAGLHRVAHSHYGLSAATLKDNTVLVAVELKEEYVCDHGGSCQNGYMSSISLPSLPLEVAEVKIVGMVYLASSLKEWLSSDEGVALTRRSISQFEAFTECDQIEAHKMATMETIRGLFLPHLPGANKIHATMDHQINEDYLTWMALVSEVKATWRAEWEKEKEKEKKDKMTTSSASVSQNEKNTQIVIQM